MAEQNPLPQISREQSLDAKPVAIEVVSRKPLPDGGERITVPFKPSGVYRWLLRVPETATKQFDLDPIGVQVMGLCDGSRSIRLIAKELAKSHQLNEHEAQRAVIAFAQTLMRKGLISLVVAKK